VTLERTPAQTAGWFLGHRLTVLAAACVVIVWVVTASAMATPSPVTPQPGDRTAATGTITVTVTATRPAATTTGTVAVRCSSATTLTFTGTGAGLLRLAVSGPAAANDSGLDRVSATVTGPAGSYTADFTATGSIDVISWHARDGNCAS
jgi:hypothetical protein